VRTCEPWVRTRVRRCALGGILTNPGKYGIFLLWDGQCAPRLRTQNNTLSLEKCRAKPPRIQSRPGRTQAGGWCKEKRPQGFLRALIFDGECMSQEGQGCQWGYILLDSVARTILVESRDLWCK